MAVCSLCGGHGEWDACPKGCAYPDHKIAQKYRKHGGELTSRHKEDPANPAKPHRWPKFDKDAKAPVEREPVT